MHRTSRHEDLPWQISYAPKSWWRHDYLLKVPAPSVSHENAGLDKAHGIIIQQAAHPLGIDFFLQFVGDISG